MAEVATLQMVRVLSMPKPCAWRSAAKVSAVSPDWLMVTTKLRGLATDVRYRYSLATSTWQGMWAILSSQYLATHPL